MPQTWLPDGSLSMTRREFRELSPDYRLWIDDRPHALALDPKNGATVLAPVTFRNDGSLGACTACGEPATVLWSAEAGLIRWPFCDEDVPR